MRLSEIALFTPNVDQVARFYEHLLGTPACVEPGEKAEFHMGSVTILIHAKVGAAPGELPDEDHVAFAVDDVDSSCQSLVAQGFTLAFGPTDYPWGRSAYLRDPDGRLVELHREP